MPSSPVTEVEDLNHQNGLVDTSLPKTYEHSLEHKNEEDEEDEEDLDFNPFLKETPSLEASSSLSSEIEGFNADVADSGERSFPSLARNLSSRPLGTVQDYNVGDSEHGEEIVMQTAVSTGEALQKGTKKICLSGPNEGQADPPPQSKDETFCHEKGSYSKTNVVNDLTDGDFGNLEHSWKAIDEINDDDAICMRTRARYSLASFTLDELETFLQETDDDDDLQNVDDEEEYKKFLAAVLLGKECDNVSTQENENVDDEDEDNDADFELELEEALESDIDENARNDTLEQSRKAVARRSRARKNKPQNAAAHSKKNNLGLLNRPLRPLLPNAAATSFASLDGKILMPGKALQSSPSSTNIGLVFGFTPQQIGQLHCLIHEHVQLLIQVFSLCIAESSRAHIASEIQLLISEILGKLNETLGWRKVPYPSFCFSSSHVNPSLPLILPNNMSTLTSCQTFPKSDVQSEFSSMNNVLLPYSCVSSAKGRGGFNSDGQLGELQVTDFSCWLPCTSDAVFSVLDVAPLKLVRCYMDDVCNAVREIKQQPIEVSCDARFEKEPLFPFHDFQSPFESNGQSLSGAKKSISSAMLSASVSIEMPRKTLAAALVEKAKKQLVAPVLKEISKLAQRFIPLFNPALYPHKPPPAPVANRVLFTEAEDELLAMGLMEYNTDWKAIQQRFLPCKTKHQIFVRQKNRSSSKAPENPIKAVRRMKNSPLTAEEKTRIEEGLKIFKLNWMSVWKFVVPYRDPSLLPRQWRIATGTQKSYKMDADKKAKRRLYEAKRRKSRPEALENGHTSSEKEECSTDNAAGTNNSTDDCMDKEDEAYVHEAFLADWRPGILGDSLKDTVGHMGPKEVPNYPLLQEGSNAMEQVNCRGSKEPQRQTDHAFSTALRYSKSQVPLRSYRARRSKNTRLVKLAPGLPPVNLPPSVRVMSRSAFENYVGNTSSKVSGSDDATARPPMDAVAPKIRFIANPLNSGQARSDLINPGTSNMPQQVFGDECAANGKTVLDLHMHPLLFHTPEGACLSSYSANYSALSTFDFLPGHQPHLKLSLFHNSHQRTHDISGIDKTLKSKEAASSALSMDFHPLLQRTNNDNYLVPASAFSQKFSIDEPLSGKCTQFRNQLGSVSTKSGVNHGPVTSNKPSSTNEKSNELDLEMHLSSTSRREKSARSKGATEESAKSSGDVPCSANSLPDGSNMERNANVHATNSCDKANKNTVNNLSELSLQEIIMEQEELSDSEEEIDENVEFECEEMADSEEEDSDAEQIVEMQTNKEIPVGKNNLLPEGVGFDGNSADNACPSLEGYSTCPNPQKYPNVGLDLNSCNSNSLNTKSEDTGYRRCSTDNKKGHNLRIRQHDLGSLDSTLPSRPKKRRCRMDSSLG